MKTKLLYVLVSTDKDFYLEQAYVSMYSAKYHMPDAHIALLVDRLTEEGFIGNRKAMLKFVDELIVADLDKSLSGKKRSRMLKTSFRQYVSGDVLFLDCDTVVVKPLYEIDNLNTDIAACRDLHTSLQQNPVRDSLIQRDMKLLRYCYGNNEPYYNSGVMYVKDNIRTRSFFSNWYENYMKGYERGVSMDQPSFAITNLEHNYLIQPLFDGWNCQLKHGIKYLGAAKIVHYLGTSKSDKDENLFFILCNASEMFNIKRTGIISEFVKQVVVDPFKGLPDDIVFIVGKEVAFKRTLLCNFFHTMYMSHIKLFNFCNASLKGLLVVGSFIKKLLTLQFLRSKRGGKLNTIIFQMRPCAERRAA